MGATGSTRWGDHTPKTTVERCRKIKVSQILGVGTLVWNDGAALAYRKLREHPWVVASFTSPEIRGERMLKFALSSSQPGFGGHRQWLRCPKCDRRCRVLYQKPGHPDFLCRICNDLTYESTQSRKTKDEILRKLLHR